MSRTYADAIREQDAREDRAREIAGGLVATAIALAETFIGLSNTREHATRGRALMLEVMADALNEAIKGRFGDE